MWLKKNYILCEAMYWSVLILGIAFAVLFNNTSYLGHYLFPIQLTFMSVFLFVALPLHETVGQKAKKFKEIFEMRAPRSEEDIEDMKPLVDRVLTERAFVLKEARNAQEQSLKSVGNTVEDVKKRILLRKRVQRAKKAFWNASDTAAYFGFIIKEKHEQWLVADRLH